MLPSGGLDVDACVGTDTLWSKMKKQSVQQVDVANLCVLPLEYKTCDKVTHTA